MFPPNLFSIKISPKNAGVVFHRQHPTSHRHHKSVSAGDAGGLRSEGITTSRKSLPASSPAAHVNSLLTRKSFESFYHQNIERRRRTIKSSRQKSLLTARFEEG